MPFALGSASSGWGTAGGETTTSGCRACDRGLDERKGQTWGGAESGGWQSPTDPRAQRSSESHSSQPSYAGDSAFNGGGIGGPGWPGGGASDESQVGQDLIGYAIQGLGCMLGCSTANAVAPGESGQSRVGYGEQALGVAASVVGAKALGAIAGVIGREVGAEVGAVATKAATHLNSNTAVSHFGIYKIMVNGKLHKIGKADLSRVTQSSGLPTRIHHQLRKLAKIHGDENVRGVIVEDLGQTTTSAAKAVEASRIQSIYETTGQVPPGNERSFRP